jgi:hypothetical protein
LDFKLDANDSDLIWVNGPLTKADVTQPFTENVRQRLLILLRTFAGEWFMSTTYGIPYWDILGKKRPKATVDRIFQEKILAENGVKEILFFESSLNNRVYSMKFSVRCYNGEDLTLEINDIGA